MMIIIVSQYGASAIIDKLQDNHQMIHHGICLTEEFIYIPLTVFIVIFTFNSIFQSCSDC